MTQTEEIITSYHFTGKALLDGTPLPAIGEWIQLPSPTRPPVLCEWGFHASREAFDALRYGPGPLLHRVEVRGEIQEGEDKLCGRSRRILATIDATALLRQFARECALSVAHIWNAPDVVRLYLETGDEALREEAGKAASEAWAAANAAANAAAAGAAWAAAGDAGTAAAAGAVCAVARAAANAAAAAAARQTATTLEAVLLPHRARFTELVEAAFADSSQTQPGGIGL